MKNAAFPGTLTDRDQLNSILSRAVTCSRIQESDSLDDDIRVLKHVGARFLGRSVYRWVAHEDESVHLKQVQEAARRVHSEISEECVLQACLFEAVDPNLEKISIPSWVFEDMGLPVEKRNFKLSAMKGKVATPGQGLGLPWLNGFVPDISCLETRLWFYYRAVSYLKRGIEAIHIGQIHLISGDDKGYHLTEELLMAIRKAAVRHARRGWVILDAHSHGISRNGRHFFDFTSRPGSARAITSRPEAMSLIRRGTRLAGIHPGGWECEDLPVLLEVDNWLGYSLDRDDPVWFNPAVRSLAGRWGYDESNWFARQSPGYRKEYLRYARNWAFMQGSEWYFQPMVRRPLATGSIQANDGTLSLYYRANNASAACPQGFGDEDAIRDILADTGAQIRNKYIQRENGEAISESGLGIPEPVTVVGQVQEQIGGIPGDASCPWSRLHHVGNGAFEALFCFPLKGVFSFSILTGGTGIDPTNSQGMSGDLAYNIKITEVGQVIRFRFVWEERTLVLTDVHSGKTVSHASGQIEDKPAPIVLNPEWT